MDVFDVSLSGLNVEWRRLEVIAQNLAMMSATNADGSAPSPMEVVSSPQLSFQQILAAQTPVGATFSVEPQDVDPRRVLDPEHPHADEEGFVTYAGVDQVSEMTQLIRASRSYEANLTVFTIAQQMYRSALDAGQAQ